MIATDQHTLAQTLAYERAMTLLESADPDKAHMLARAWGAGTLTERDWKAIFAIARGDYEPPGAEITAGTLFDEPASFENMGAVEQLPQQDRPLRTLSTAKGMTVETPLSDQEAIACCRRHAGTFAQDLARKFKAHGRLSDDQWTWAHKLALEAMGQRDAGGFDLGSFQPIADLFATAAAKLQSPKVLLQLKGHEVRLSLCGKRSKYTGQVHVCYATDYVGRITKEGKFIKCGPAPAELIDLLRRFAAAPAATLFAAGRLTSRCCVCNIELKDKRSVAAGMGEKCAKNYGLHAAWKVAVAEALADKQLDGLDGA